MVKTIHKLHLYLGLLSALILMIVGLSGSILSYEKELLYMLHKESFVVAKKPEGKLELSKIVDSFLEQKKDAKINAFTLWSDSNASYKINIASKDNRKGDNYYVNPYTGEILPEVSSEVFFKWVENLHRRVLLGEVGKQIVGASVLILIFLLISGIYLYMPKIKRGLLNAFKINPKAKGRLFLYMLHGSVGLWLIPLYLVVSLSGLYWSYTWYNLMLFAISGVEKPQRPLMQELEQKSIIKEQGIKEENQRKTLSQGENIAQAFKSFDTLIERSYTYSTLRMPKQEDEFSFTYIDKIPAHPYARNQLILNSATMQLLKHERYNDKDIPTRLMSSMLALHSGEFFGWIGQLLMFLASLLMPLFGITGLMLYIKKRK